MSKLGTPEMHIIASASNGTRTSLTLFAPASACWRTKVISNQPPMQMIPILTPTEARLTLESAALWIPLTLLTSIVSF